MKRIFAISSLIAVLFATTLAFAKTQPKSEKIGKEQLNTLIATAKTPAEHQRIANYYQVQAQDYRAQAQEHEGMVAAYKANSSLSTDKNRTSTIGHCEYFVKTFKDMAVESQELARLHEEMAKNAAHK